MPSFQEDLHAFTEALGPAVPELVLPLADADRADATERNRFTSALVRVLRGE